MSKTDEDRSAWKLHGKNVNNLSSLRHFQSEEEAVNFKKMLATSTQWEWSIEKPRR